MAAASVLFEIFESAVYMARYLRYFGFSSVNVASIYDVICGFFCSDELVLGLYVVCQVSIEVTW